MSLCLSSLSWECMGEWRSNLTSVVTGAHYFHASAALLRVRGLVENRACVPVTVTKTRPLSFIGTSMRIIIWFLSLIKDSGEWLHAFLTSVLRGTEWSAYSHGHFIPGKRAFWANWIRRWVSLRSYLTVVTKKGSLGPTKDQTSDIQPLADADWAIPVPLCGGRPIQNFNTVQRYWYITCKQKLLCITWSPP